MNKPTEQNGFVSLTAAILILIVAVVALASAGIISSRQHSVNANQKSTQALFIAEAGLEQGNHLINTPKLADRKSCSDLPGINSNFGTGSFSLSGSFGKTGSAAILQSSITAASTTLSLNNSAGYAAYGRVMIDNETIEYDNIIGNNLQVRQRGVDGTSAIAHASGARVAQHQCSITSTGTVPGIKLLAGKRRTRDILQLQRGFTVGDANGGEVIGEWNGSSWLRDGPTAAVPNMRLNGIYALNAADAWAVGNPASLVGGGLGALIARWDGAQWTRIIPQGNVPATTLNSVHCTSANNCWAVGDSAGGNATFVHGSAGIWSQVLPDASVASKPLKSVHCANSNDCWAVGNKANSNANLNHWNGTTWSRVLPHSSVPYQHLFGVFCVASNDCWAVGNRSNGKALYVHWNGGQWARITPGASVPYQHLRGITCIASDDCWAVGNRDGGNALITHWNGSSWTRIIPEASVPYRHLLAVDCTAKNDCWAVGYSSGGENIIHWDGSSWKRVGPVGSIPNVRLYSISMVGSANGQATSHWEEVFA